MAKLLILQGPQGSGKTTYAMSLLPSLEWGRVNRDDIRFALFGSYWGAEVDENVVTRVEDTAVYQLLKAGRNVVLDATNLNQYNLDKKLLNLPPNTEVEYKRFEVPMQTALYNDAQRLARGERGVGPHVIVSFYEKNNIDRETGKW